MWYLTAVSLYEKGERCPNISYIITAARFFGVSTDYLLGMSETPTPDMPKEKEVQYISRKTGLQDYIVESLIALQKARTIGKET